MRTVARKNNIIIFVKSFNFWQNLSYFIENGNVQFLQSQSFRGETIFGKILSKSTQIRDFFSHWKPLLPADVDTRQPFIKEGRRKTERKGRMVAILAISGDSKKARTSPKIYNQLLDRNIYLSNNFVVFTLSLHNYVWWGWQIRSFLDSTLGVEKQSVTSFLFLGPFFKPVYHTANTLSRIHRF